MTGDARADWLERWEALQRQGQDAKDSQGVLLRLADHYRSLDDGSKDAVNAVLIEWVESTEEARRFDAIALVSEFAIASALPALRRLADELEKSPAPSAPFEWAKVNGVIGRLAAGAG